MRIRYYVYFNYTRDETYSAEAGTRLCVSQHLHQRSLAGPSKSRGSLGARKILQKCSSFRHEPQVFRGMQDESDLLEMLVSAVVPESPTALGINCVRLVACVGIPTVWCGANDWVPCMPHPARNPILRPRKSDLCMIDITEADVKGVVPSFPSNDLGCCHSFLLPLVVGIC